jgi:hypothetical protein
LLLMYVAERNLQPDELTRTFDRYGKLTQEAARQIVDFLRTARESPEEGRERFRDRDGCVSAKPRAARSGMFVAGSG